MTELEDILKQFIDQIAKELKDNTPKNTGATANSIEVQIKKLQDGVSGSIVAAPYFVTLETGRGPTKNGGGGGKTLQQSILEWIQQKSIVPQSTGFKKAMTQEQLSWAIAIKIHREGNKLYRSGGKSGVISNVINDQRINTFVEVFNSKGSRIILQNVLKKIKQ